MRKIAWLWKPSSDSVDTAESTGQTSLGLAYLPLKALVIGPGIAFGLLAIAGVVHGRGSEMPILPAAVIVLWTGFYVLFFAISRYQLPLLPLLAVPAAAAIEAFLARRTAT